MSLSADSISETDLMPVLAGAGDVGSGPVVKKEVKQTWPDETKPLVYGGDDE